MQPLAQPYIAAGYQRCRVGLAGLPSLAIQTVVPAHAEPYVLADRAQEQHAVFTRRLGELGVALEVLPANERGLCFAVGDLAVVVEGGAVLMRPSDLDRQAEVALVEAHLLKLGVPIVGQIEAPGILDGGDVLLAEGTAYIGVPHGDGAFKYRNNSIGREQFASLTKLRVLEVAVNATVPRLNSLATLLDATTVILGGAYVDHAPFEGLNKIVVPTGEELAAGMLVLGERRVLANLRFRETPALLKQAKLTVESLDLWEFGKLGFSPANLMLAISRK